MEQYGYEMAVSDARQHERVYQYTTFEALEKIICNRSLRLTRMDLLNDTLENEKIHDLWKNKVYVSCFTNRGYESYFFWKTYARGSSDGVRISFKTDCLLDLSVAPDKKCENKLLKYEKENIVDNISNIVSKRDWEIFDYSVLDIKYLQRDADISESKEFLGRYKYREWDMEQETRIRVAIRPRGLEFETKGLDDFEYIKPEEKHLYLGLSDDVLKSMQLTLSPFADCDLRKEVENLLKDNMLDDIRVEKSLLTDEVK